MTRFTNDQLLTVLRLHQDGLPLRVIGDQTGLTTEQVKHALNVVRKIMANGLSVTDTRYGHSYVTDVDTDTKAVTGSDT